MHSKFDKDLYLEEFDNLKSYIWNITYLFLRFSEYSLLEKEEKEKMFQKFYSENIKFFEYSDIENPDYLNYCLFINKKPYEIFASIWIKDFFLLDDALLEKIFSWEIKICIFDNFQKIAILNYTYTIPDKVEKIIN